MQTQNTIPMPQFEPMDTKTRASAEVVLDDIKRCYGTEGLNALYQVKHAPEHATPWQQATALHIRAELGPETFWLDAALLLWREEQ